MDSRLDELVAALTVGEKLRLIRGCADPDGRATGYLSGVERLGVPPLGLVDGPLGVRDRDATAFPATLALGATWNPGLARRVGTALAAETRAKGHDVLLAPGLNVIRVPTGGRNFEYLGEDPRLIAEIGGEYVRGVQAGGVGATAKHFVANNQEHDRDTVDAIVDERTLREVYFPGFRSAVEAGVSAVMAAYNRVNGDWMSEHAELLEETLRGEWGFEGVVMSDWWGTHDTINAATGGLDVEMPGVSPPQLYAPRSRLLGALVRLNPSGRLGLDPPLVWRAFDQVFGDDGQPDPYPYAYFGDRLRRALASGSLPEAILDRKVRHVLGLYDVLGLLDGSSERPSGTVDYDAHHDLARRVAVRGTIILSNDGLLPLSSGASLAVIGPNADAAKVGGGGSSEVRPVRTVSPVDGLKKCAPAVTFERGVARVPEPSMYELPGTSRIRRLRSLIPSGDVDFDAAVAAADDADIAVVVVQDAAAEGEDRESMSLPGGQNRLVRAVARENPRTVVVCRSSGPVTMPWVDDVAAVIQTWYPGQADGVALGDVLYGEDPGGRLPVTFGRQFADYPVADERRYPGVDGRVYHEEGVFVGYRGFDRDGVDPLFPFGHGRSYAEFAYDDASVTASGNGYRVGVTVTNTSRRAGREVAQIYMSPPDGPVERPPKVLAGFAQFDLDAGERDRVTLTVPMRALARYDSTDGWTVDSGEYELLVGRSSRDIRERAVVDAE